MALQRWRTWPSEPSFSSAPYRPNEDDFYYNVTRTTVLDVKPNPDAMPPWLTAPEGMKEETTAFMPGRHGWRRPRAFLQRQLLHRSLS